MKILNVTQFTLFSIIIFPWSVFERELEIMVHNISVTSRKLRDSRI